MERRIFLSIMGGVPLAAAPELPGCTHLTAIAAEHLPQKALLHGHEASPGTILELRCYQDCVPAENILARHGIRLIFAEPAMMVVSFPDLEARDRAWTKFSSDAEWLADRRNTTAITLYKAE
jgi:hypothetical protein